MAWTSITANISWQDLTVAQEIATAYNKRADVAGADSIETELAVVSIDTDVTVFDFVSACQDGIEAMATDFADSSATLTGQSSYIVNFASVAAMMTAAGLTESGYWRRIADTGSNPVTWTDYDAVGWSYGGITDKDLAGPWLFKDLQTALTGLTRVIIEIDPNGTTQGAGAYSGSDHGAFEAFEQYPPTGAPGDFGTTSPAWFVWSKRRVRYAAAFYNIFQFYETGAADRSVTGLGSYTKNIDIIILPELNATTFYSWGAGWTEDETALLDSAAATSAASFDYTIDFDTTFAGLYAGSGGGDVEIDEGFYSAEARAVITYDFNP